jgi:hypothetical protein
MLYDGKVKSHRMHMVKVTTPKRIRAEATTLKFNGLIAPSPLTGDHRRFTMVAETLHGEDVYLFASPDLSDRQTWLELAYLPVPAPGFLWG